MHPRKRLEGIVDECRQIIVDMSAWADLHPDERPIDVEDCRVILALALEAIDAWDNHGSKSDQFEGAVARLQTAATLYGTELDASLDSY